MCIVVAFGSCIGHSYCLCLLGNCTLPDPQCRPVPSNPELRQGRERSPSRIPEKDPSCHSLRVCLVISHMRHVTPPESTAGTQCRPVHGTV